MQLIPSVTRSVFAPARASPGMLMGPGLCPGPSFLPYHHSQDNPPNPCRQPSGSADLQVHRGLPDSSTSSHTGPPARHPHEGKLNPPPFPQLLPLCLCTGCPFRQAGPRHPDLLQTRCLLRFMAQLWSTECQSPFVGDQISVLQHPPLRQRFGQSKRSQVQEGAARTPVA